MFFVDFSDRHLQRAVDRGRRREYSAQQWDGAIAPSRIEAFHQSRATRICDQSMWDWYRKLLALRLQWRNEGVLKWQNMHVDCRVDQSVFSLAYQDATGKGPFIVSRFAAVDQSLPRLSIAVQGEVLMESSTEQVAAENYVLHEHAVLIGNGRWRFDS